MKIQCDCGEFQAELLTFPKNTPGRLKCYCDDCQAYLQHLGRSDLLDQNGGTEIIPIYPSEMKIVAGAEQVRCTRLSRKGLYRFSTRCCSTPIANTLPRSPWMGVVHCMFAKFPDGELERALGPIRASIMGKFAIGTPPAGTPEKFNLKGFMVVMPHILKGKLSGKAAPSPFFTLENRSIVAPQILDKRS